MMGRCHHQRNPTDPPHLAWLVYTGTSESLNSEKTLSVLPFSAKVLSSVTHVRKNVCGGNSSSVYEGSGIRSPFKIPQDTALSPLDESCFICLVSCSSTYAQSVTFLSGALFGSFSHPQSLSRPTC